MRINNHVLIVILVSCCASCSQPKPSKDFEYLNHISEMELLTKLAEQQFLKNKPIDSEFTFHIDKQAVGILNTSTSAIGQAIREIYISNDSISFDELLDKQIVFRNNKGKLITIPIRSVLEEPQ